MTIDRKYGKIDNKQTPKQIKQNEIKWKKKQEIKKKEKMNERTNKQISKEQILQV